MKKSGASIIIGLIMLAALAGAVILTSKNQETRRSAYFAGSRLFLLPTDKALTFGETFPVQLWVETTDGAKVVGVTTQLCYDSTKLSVDETNLAGVVTTPPSTANSSFNEVLAVSMAEGNYPSGVNRCVNMSVVSSNIPEADLSSGLVNVAKIMFKAVASGTSGTVIIDKNNSVVAGNSTTTDAEMSVDSVTGMTYTIEGAVMPTNTPTVTPTVTPTPTPPTTGNWPILKYSLSFRNVVPGNMCATGWPVTITAMAANGTTKIYTNQMPVRDTTITDRVVYKGQLTLTDFPYTNGLSIFIKGPKHLQTKYGVNNQEDYYNQPGGAITLTNDPNTTPVYDFSKYPLMPGDVTGAISGVQDGTVDGRDYAFIKAVATERTEVADGQFLLPDLDGNCQVDGMDTAYFKLTLKDRLEQIY